MSFSTGYNSRLFLGGEQSTLPSWAIFWGAGGSSTSAYRLDPWLSNLTMHRNNPRCLLRMLIPRLLRVSDSVGWWWSQDVYILIKLLRRLWHRWVTKYYEKFSFRSCSSLAFFAGFSFTLCIYLGSLVLSQHFSCHIYAGDIYISFYNSDFLLQSHKFKTSLLTPCWMSSMHFKLIVPKSKLFYTYTCVMLCFPKLDERCRIRHLPLPLLPSDK